MLELLFLMSFTLHNIEEALWLPRWSRHARRFHQAVTPGEFHFGVFVVTVLGYLLTFLFLVCGETQAMVRYVYFGYVLMMVVNAVFPHLAACVALRRYAPGTITGLALNLPIGLYLVFAAHAADPADWRLWLGLVVVGGGILASLKPLFRLRAWLLPDAVAGEPE